MKVSFEPLASLEVLGEHWRELEERAAESSFFQSWTWVSAWLRALPDRAALRLLTVTNGGQIVALGVLGSQTLRRHRVLPVRGLFLSETGDPALDTLTMEHNGLLLDAVSADAALAAALPALRDAAPWDELKIAGVERRAAERYRAAFPVRGCRLLERNEKPYFTVALERLRAEGRDFLATLSSNTRSQVRRAMREYEKRGPLTVRVATGEAEAAEVLGALRELHQEYWRAQGMPGAFATPFANGFHRELIAAGLPRGEIQLATIASGEQPVGYLYNFVHRGAVLNYQSGLVYGADSKLKPGLVAHALLIEENLQRGARVYDLLMGNQRYKKSLATDEGVMSELVVQRNRVKFRLEDLARAARDAMPRRRAIPAAEQQD
jgi:CelD/BcsL family acetyltransferase involved in cellulose biosynthesis